MARADSAGGSLSRDGMDHLTLEQDVASFHPAAGRARCCSTRKSVSADHRLSAQAVLRA